jgi:membrane protein implicated in regulation of membrane protease activity
MRALEEQRAPMTWFVVFAITVFGLWFWREYRIQQRDLESASSPHRMGERYIGRVITVPKGIANGSGRIKLGPRHWSLRGPDVPAGGQVRITGVDGQVLIVDPAGSIKN